MGDVNPVFLDSRLRGSDGKIELVVGLLFLNLDNASFRGYDVGVNFWFRLPLRTRLGIISCSLLTCAVVMLLSWYHDPANFSYRSGWVIRFGPLIFLLWLAWSDLEKIPWWNWLILLVLLIACSIKPAFWFVGIPTIAYMLMAKRKS